MQERSAPTMAGSVIVGEYGNGSIQENGGIGRGPLNAKVGIGSGLGDAIGERIDEVDDDGRGWGRRPMGRREALRLDLALADGVEEDGGAPRLPLARRGGMWP